MRPNSAFTFSRHRGFVLYVLLFSIALIYLLWFLYLALGYLMSHEQNRQGLQDPGNCPKVARELALHCQSTDKETRLEASEGRAVFPSLIQPLNPSYGSISPQGAHFEMHGGHDHYGYMLKLDVARSGSDQNVWDLSYYSEGSSTKVLCSVTLDKNERISTGSIINTAVDDWDRQIRSNPVSEDLRQQKILYLADHGQFEAVEEACVVYMEDIPKSADQWWPNLTLAHARCRLNRCDAAAEEYQEWTQAHPSFTHYVYLFLFQRAESRPQKAIAAIAAASQLPFSESHFDSFNKFALAHNAAMYAFQQKEYALAEKLCGMAVNDRAIEPTWAHSFHAVHAATFVMLGQQERALTSLAASEQSGRKVRFNVLEVQLPRLREAIQSGNRSSVQTMSNWMGRPPDWLNPYRSSSSNEPFALYPNAK